MLLVLCDYNQDNVISIINFDIDVFAVIPKDTHLYQKMETCFLKLVFSAVLLQIQKEWGLPKVICLFLSPNRKSEGK